MRRGFLSVVFAVAVASGAMALPIDAVPADVVTVAQMPLAVAEVSQIDGVALPDLMSVIATMNRALVPPSEFIEVVRYTPVALADTEQPFPTYVTSQVDRGVTGERLAADAAVVGGAHAHTAGRWRSVTPVYGSRSTT